MRRLPLFVILASCLRAISSPAQAPTPEAIRFQYEAPAECPDAATFTARVRQRTARGRLAEPGELARNFALSIRADAKGFLGAIEFLDDSGASVSRRVHGEQCDEVVSSLALITALALDASLRESQVEPAAPPEQAPAPIARSTPAPARVAGGARARPQLPSDRMHARVGVAAGYDVRLEALSLGLLGEHGWPSGMNARFTAHYAASERTIDSGRRAQLRLIGLESSFCPRAFRAGELTLYPCVAFDLGTLHAQGVRADRLTKSGSGTILWVAVGPTLRLAWEPDGPFWLELNGRLEFPLVRHEFVFNAPHATVLKVEPVTKFSGGAAIASGVRFW